MITRTGRNDPCPCGSGKKYKKCCLVSSENADFQYRRWRQIESGLIPKLMDFAFESFGPELLEDAWKDFNVGEAVEAFDPESSMNMVFMPWFLFTWLFDIRRRGSNEFLATTIAEQFLTHDLKVTSADEQTLLLSANRCHYSLCEVVEVEPGVGMTQFDLLRRIKYKVIERSASQDLKRGEIIYCATTEVGGIKSNIGTSPYALSPIAKRDVLELRKWIMAETGKEKLSAEHLHEFEYDIRGLYLHILKGMFAPPDLANTDKDPFVPHKLYFDIDSADRTFHGLKALAEGASEAELLKDAIINDGLLIKAEVPWLGGSEEARKRLGGPLLLGLLKIDENRLVVEVNSKQRAQLVRRLVEERLGNTATYKTTLIEPIESHVEEMWKVAATGLSSSGSQQGRERLDLV
jgi:hypothetical protein